MWFLLALPLIVIILFVIFYAICRVCESHLVPSIEVFIRQYQIPEDVAGVTLIAFGSACPELLLNIVSAQENESSLSQPALLGSAMIAFGLIPPLCCFFSAKPFLLLKTKPLLRDCTVYVIALMAFLYFSKDGITDPREMISMVVIYVVYVLTALIFTSGAPPSSEVGKKDGNPTKEDDHQMHAGPTSENEDGTMPDTDEEKTFVFWARVRIQWLVKLTSGVTGMLDEASEKLLHYSMPLLVDDRDAKQPVYDKVSIEPLLRRDVEADRDVERVTYHRVAVGRACTVLASAILHITLLVWALIQACLYLLEVLPGVSSTTIGGTVVAFGSQLPDITSSVALARGGLCNAAMAGAVGSQVINLTLGVALPALSLLMTGAKVKIDVDEVEAIGLLTGLVFLVLFFYLLSIVPFTTILKTRTLPDTSQLSRSWASFLLIAFCLSYGIFIGENEAYRRR